MDVNGLPVDHSPATGQCPDSVVDTFGDTGIEPYWCDDS